MKQNLKKFFICLLAVCLFFATIFFLLKFYDPTGDILSSALQNTYYFIFVFISILFGLFLYGNEDSKSKFTISVIILSNFILLIFVFLFSNVGLDTLSGVLLVGFLILGLVSNYIKNRFGHIITIFSILGILTIILIAIVPMYEKGPDIKGFEDQFGDKLLVYSMASLNPKAAVLEKDQKAYNLLNGLFVYDFNINKDGSMLLFKSDRNYQNVFGFLLLENQEIIQIYPQSGIKIRKNENIEIEIISGIIKFFPENPKNFYFTGSVLPSLMVDQENIKIVSNWYNQELKNHIINQIGGDILRNQTISNMSKYLLNILYKTFPKKFSENIKNFENFQKYVDTSINNLDERELFDEKKIQQGIIKDIKESLNNTEIIK